MILAHRRQQETRAVSTDAPAKPPRAPQAATTEPPPEKPAPAKRPR